ncbi:MAG TPA: DUF1707 domain-containing protein [Mycobacterium sp.]
MATRQSTGTRAKDSDRTDTCQVLDSALAEGQLSIEEHRQRVSAATAAATLGELRSLVSDLQSTNAGVQLPKLKPQRRAGVVGGGWGMRLAVAAVLVLFGVGVGWGIFGHSSPLRFQRSDPGATPDGIAANTDAPPRLLHSANGLNGLLTQARKKWGDTMGYSLTVYPDYASMERADPSDDRRVMRYTYRGGWDSSPSVSGKSGSDKLVDLGRLDVNAIVGKLRGAPAILGIEAQDVKSTYLNIEGSKDPTTPDALDISIYVSTTYDKSGYLRVDPDGNVTSQYPPS